MFNRVAGWHRSHSYEYADAIRTYCLSTVSELRGLLTSAFPDNPLLKLSQSLKTCLEMVIVANITAIKISDFFILLLLEYF